MTLIGIIFALFYYANERHFLGWRVLSWIRGLLIFFSLLLWLRVGHVAWLGAGFGLFLIVQILFWIIRRMGYTRFMPEEGSPPAAVSLSLNHNRRLPTRASGVFGGQNRQAQVVERPAEFWRVPIGESVLMVREQSGKYLYEFVQPENLRGGRAGRLLFGPHPSQALAVSFLSTWGPESAGYEPGYFVRDTGHLPKIEKTIYLTFEEEGVRQAVWYNLVRET